MVSRSDKVLPSKVLPSRDFSQDFWRNSALPYVESRRACMSRACYRAHAHPTFSIGAVDEGISVFTGAVDGPITLQPGTLVFIPAARVHACNPLPDTAWSYQMLHVDAEWLWAVRGEYVSVEESFPEPIRVVTNPEMYRSFCQLNALLFSPAAAVEKETALIEFIADYDDREGFFINKSNAPSEAIEKLKPVWEYLGINGNTMAPLSELAALSDLSSYQLIRTFRAVTGMTPQVWQMNQRINLARDLLRVGMSLSSVAYQLGFSDQAHFQRVFKAYAGVTPGRFRIEN